MGCIIREEGKGMQRDTCAVDIHLIKESIRSAEKKKGTCSAVALNQPKKEIKNQTKLLQGKGEGRRHWETNPQKN